MEIIRDKKLMREWSRKQKAAGKTVAFVPTMGFLHDGHLSLVREARQRADVVVVSVYVNPSQFAPGEDLASYPKDLEGDIEKLKPLNVEAVFNPYDLYVRAGSKKSTNEDVTGTRPSTPGGQTDGGPDSGDRENGGKQVQRGVSVIPVSCLEEDGESGHETWIRVEKLERPLCGVSRPVFFRGVATIVAKLFNIVEPDHAVFGKKDYQQWCVIKRMVRDLDFDVEVIGCPLIREADGLAMSSRNVRLSPAERQQALSISRSLQECAKLVEAGESEPEVLTRLIRQAISVAGGKVDYVEVVEQETLQAVRVVNSPVVFAVAAWFGNVRLLDNIEVSPFVHSTL